jgi:hypothetical protein
MIPIEEQSASASSMLCVVSTTVHSLRVVESRDMMSHMKRRAPGSTPVLGSSKKTSCGEPILQYFSVE